MITYYYIKIRTAIQQFDVTISILQFIIKKNLYIQLLLYFKWMLIYCHMEIEIC